MIKLIRITLILVLLAGFFILNIYFFARALEFSKIFPFKRALMGNTLTVNIDMAESSFKFGSKIIKIEGEDADNKNLSSLLAKHAGKNELNVTVNTEGRIINKTLIKNKKNNDYLLFLIFFILFGNIHYLWGGIVYFFNPHEIRSKLFLFSSMALSFFYYNMAEKFTFGSYSITFVLITLFLGFQNVLLGFNLTNLRMNRLISGTILIFILVMIIYSLSIIDAPDSIIDIALFIYIVFCSFFILVSLIYGIIKNNYSFVIWRSIVLLIGLIIGNSIPVSNILLSGFSDLSLPVCISSSLTLFFPLLLGNTFLRYNQYDSYGFKVFQLTDIKLLSYNIVVAVISAVLLYSALTIPGLAYYKILYLLAAVIIILILLNGEQFLVRGLRNFGYENKDNYAFSVQKIAELCSSSITLEDKVDHIYQEISGITGAASLRFILFLNAHEEYNPKLREFMEVLSKDSDIFSLINKNKGIILKHTLIRNSALEERVYKFLKERNFILAIPIIEGKKTSALLAGERTAGGFYSNADIHYFKTVTHQIFQLIESDCLYKDYILKKQYEKELDNASYVQLRLFPRAILEDRGIDISFFYRPYLRVIGDYFDFFKVDEDRTAIVVGDVSGHGLSTAMVLSAVKAITHAMLREEMTFEKTFVEINNYLNKSYKGIELITLFIGIFNRQTKIMEYINAGHGAPILIKKHEKRIQHIEGRTKILGADPDAKYIASNIGLDKDDELILYTDGVMEIYNEKTGSGFNEEMFINIIEKNIEIDINSKIIEIEKIIKFYSEDIKDDITIIGVTVH